MAGSPLPYVNVRRFREKLVAEVVNGDLIPLRVNLRDNERRHVRAQR
jgi:hypothetical protein